MQLALSHLPGFAGQQECLQQAGGRGLRSAWAWEWEWVRRTRASVGRQGLPDGRRSVQDKTLGWYIPCRGVATLYGTCAGHRAARPGDTAATAHSTGSTARARYSTSRPSGDVRGPPARAGAWNRGPFSPWPGSVDCGTGGSGRQGDGGRKEENRVEALWNWN